MTLLCQESGTLAPESRETTHLHVVCLTVIVVACHNYLTVIVVSYRDFLTVIVEFYWYCINIVICCVLPSLLIPFIKGMKTFHWFSFPLLSLLCLTVIVVSYCHCCVLLSLLCLTHTSLDMVKDQHYCSNGPSGNTFFCIAKVPKCTIISLFPY
jgi:hypothetical protein